MDIERALVSKIIATGQLERIVSAGITSEMFADEECRDAFEDIKKHTRRYKTPPSREAFRESHPDFELEHIQDSVEWVIDRFSVLVRKRAAQELVFELGAAIDDPEQADHIEQVFAQAAREIATIIPVDDVARFSDMDKRIEQTEKDQEEGVKAGIPFGFPTLDAWTGGIQKHEFITAAAFSGVGKSTLLRAIAFNIYSLPEDVVALYVSLEEERHAILRKFDAMAAHLSYQKMKQLGLEKDDFDKWREVAERVRKKMKGKDILIRDKIRQCTPDTVYMETIKHRPDIVFVDYLSLMSTSRPGRNSSMWQSLTEITQDLKQNARILEVPIIAAAQTNRSGAKDGADLDNIGYALSVVQDSDIVLGLHADEEMKEKKLMEMRVRKNREGRLGRFSLRWEHESEDGPVFREETMGDRFGRPGGKDSASKLTKTHLAKKRARPQRKREEDNVVHADFTAKKAKPRPTRK